MRSRPAATRSPETLDIGSHPPLQTHLTERTRVLVASPMKGANAQRVTMGQMRDWFAEELELGAAGPVSGDSAEDLAILFALLLR